MLKGGCLEASPFYYQAYDKKVQWTFLVAMHRRKLPVADSVGDSILVCCFIFLFFHNQVKEFAPAFHIRFFINIRDVFF